MLAICLVVHERVCFFHNYCNFQSSGKAFIYSDQFMEYETFSIYPLNPIAHFTYFMFLHNSNFFYFLSFIVQLSWGIIDVKSNWMIWWVLISVQPQNPHHTYCNLKLQWSELLPTPRRLLCELGERVPAAQQKLPSSRTPRVVGSSGLDASSPRTAARASYSKQRTQPWMAVLRSGLFKRFVKHPTKVLKITPWFPF